MKTKYFRKELDTRFANHKAGKLKYYSIEEVKKAITKALKNKK